MTGLPALLDLPETHLCALEILIRRVPPAEFLWVLTGSAGLRLQGVDIPVHDLDIQTGEETIYRIEEHLSEFMKTPVHLWESPGMRSLDGKASIAGVEVELLANLAHRRSDGTWSTLTDFSHRIGLETNGLQVFVFPLEDELAAYQAMGRAEKAALIRQAIQKAAR
jgi:hypothetical protein